MKYFHRIAMTIACLFSLLFTPTAFALSCHMMTPQEATNLYLIQLQNIALSQESDESLSGTAQVTVLKVYRGDAQVLSTIREVRLIEVCSTAWGPIVPDSGHF